MPAMTAQTLRSVVAGLVLCFCLSVTLAAASPAPESRQDQTEPQDNEALRLAAEQGDLRRPPPSPLRRQQLPEIPGDDRGVRRVEQPPGTTLTVDTKG